MKNRKKVFTTLVGTAFGIYCSAQGLQLQKDFMTPPESVKTGVYWYWMCGNISSEGVVKDLEAMKRVGINRAFIGNIYFDPYEGGRTVRLMSDEWWNVTHTALKKASELGIEIGIFNSPGWTQAGGPWVKPNEAMRYLTSSEVRVSGPQTLSVQLEKPASEFEDVRVVAYPAPKDDRLIVNQSNAQITVSPALPDATKMFDGDKLSGTGLPENTDVDIRIKTDRPFMARSLTIYPTH
ncbi:MAG: glycosyl hydrolase, partial [Bacteroidales bacterium]